MVAKVAPAAIQRFRDNKGRITDFYEHNADSIREKRTLMTTATIFAEMGWLVGEVRRLGGEGVIDNPEKFKKIAAFVERVNRDQAGAVSTGQFVKVRADVFGAWRFLVNALEETFKCVLEADEALLLASDGKLPDEDGNRIVLDLEEGLGDEDAE